jgi:hypothetical protein
MFEELTLGELDLVTRPSANQGGPAAVFFSRLWR